MGLFDSVIGALGQSQGGSPGGQGNLLGLVLGLLTQGGGAGGAAGGLGGLSDLLARMQQNGLGDVADSWVGTGANQPIGADQLGRVLGGDTVSSMASQLGTNPGDLLGQLSQLLPQVVDKLTPQGQLPQGGDLGGLLGGLMGGAGGAGGTQPDLGQLAGMLGGLLNKR